MDIPNNVSLGHSNLSTRGRLHPKHTVKTGVSLTCLNNCSLKGPVKLCVSLKQHHELNRVMISAILDRNPYLNSPQNMMQSTDCPQKLNSLIIGEQGCQYRGVKRNSIWSYNFIDSPLHQTHNNRS